MDTSQTTRSEPQGMIRFLGLTTWWMDQLTEDDRGLIERCFIPGQNTMIHGAIYASSDTPKHYLRAIAGWVKRDAPDLAARIYEAADRASAEPVPSPRRR